MTALFPVYPRLDLDVVGARGTSLFTADGREIHDLYGAHAVCPLGHAHPALHRALTAQHATLDFYSNSLRMAVQEDAARAVIGDSAHLAHVHFVNSGTEANESAMHLARMLTGRPRIVTLAEGFHGRTLGSLSVTGLAGYRRKVPLDIPEAWGATLPLGADDLSVIDDRVAGVLVESVPSLGGVYMPPDGWLERVEARCREVGALFILDEVQGGVGRLGAWWGHAALGTSRPDIVTLAKSLGGGFPVAAMVTTAEVAGQVSYGDLGTTFGGGPMACAMVQTVAQVVQTEGLLDRVMEIEAQVRSACASLAGVSVRGRGALLGVQTPRAAKDIQAALLDRDVLVGTSGEAHTIRLLPAYVTSDAVIDRFTDALAEVLDG